MKKLKVPKTIKIFPPGLEAKVLRAPFWKAKGYMFCFRRKKARLFVFKSRRKVGIHMFFVFFPITVAWLDEEKKVLHARKMWPFVSYKAHEAKYVLEVPCGRKAPEIKEGMRLSWMG